MNQCELLEPIPGVKTFRVVNLITCEIAESRILQIVYKIGRGWKKDGHEVMLFRGILSQYWDNNFGMVWNFVMVDELPII